MTFFVLVLFQIGLTQKNVFGAEAITTEKSQPICDSAVPENPLPLKKLKSLKRKVQEILPVSSGEEKKDGIESCPKGVRTFRDLLLKHSKSDQLFESSSLEPKKRRELWKDSLRVMDQTLEELSKHIKHPKFNSFRTAANFTLENDTIDEAAFNRAYAKLWRVLFFGLALRETEDGWREIRIWDSSDHTTHFSDIDAKKMTLLMNIRDSGFTFDQLMQARGFQLLPSGVEWLRTFDDLNETLESGFIPIPMIDFGNDKSIEENYHLKSVIDSQTLNISPVSITLESQEGILKRLAHPIRSALLPSTLYIADHDIQHAHLMRRFWNQYLAEEELLEAAHVCLTHISTDKTFTEDEKMILYFRLREDSGIPLFKDRQSFKPNLSFDEFVYERTLARMGLSYKKRLLGRTHEEQIKTCGAYSILGDMRDEDQNREQATLDIWKPLFPQQTEKEYRNLMIVGLKINCDFFLGKNRVEVLEKFAKSAPNPQALWENVFGVYKSNVEKFLASTPLDKKKKKETITESYKANRIQMIKALETFQEKARKVQACRKGFNL